MQSISASFGHASIDDDSIRESLSQLLTLNRLGAMASIRDVSFSYVNTAYFVYDARLTLYFLSQPEDQHVKNCENNESVAVAVWGTPQLWGTDLHGVQMFGRCEKVGVGIELISAMRLFLSAFPACASIFLEPGRFREGVNSQMFAVRVQSMKLLDERRFGRRVYISVHVSG